MKSFLLTAFILLYIGIKDIQSQGCYENYNKGERYLLANNVNIRNQPSTHSKIIDNLPIASKVFILETCEQELTLNGFTTNWLKISYNLNGFRKTGYVWGGLVANGVENAPSNEKLLFLYGIHSYNKKGNDVMIDVRAANNNRQLGKIITKAVGSLTTFNSMKVYDNKGLDGINNIIKINFSDEMCGGAFGDIYFFWQNNELTHVQTLLEGFDAPCFLENYFLFPKDKGGKQERVIQVKRSGCYEDDTQNPNLDLDEKIEFKWQGDTIVKVKQ